jgi:hypothetical protein
MKGGERSREGRIKRGVRIALLVAAAVTMRCWVLPRVLPPGTVLYHGHTIRLSKYYFDYDDYKNDPDNIAPEDRPLAANLVRTAPVPHDFATRLEMIHATVEVCFPGYGQGQFGEVGQPDGSVLAGYSVEVPAANEDRIFVFRGTGGAYTLLADFIASGDLGIRGVAREGDELVFHSWTGQVVLRRSLTGP